MDMMQPILAERGLPYIIVQGNVRHIPLSSQDTVNLIWTESIYTPLCAARTRLPLHG